MKDRSCYFEHSFFKIVKESQGVSVQGKPGKIAKVQSSLWRLIQIITNNWVTESPQVASNLVCVSSFRRYQGHTAGADGF